jgi:hypothetical protein
MMPPSTLQHPVLIIMTLRRSMGFGESPRDGGSGGVVVAVVITSTIAINPFIIRLEGEIGRTIPITMVNGFLNVFHHRIRAAAPRG